MDNAERNMLPRSGSRYADKREEEIQVRTAVRTGSRYADVNKTIAPKQTSKIVSIRTARRKVTRRHSRNAFAAFVSSLKAKDPLAVAGAAALGILFAGYIAGGVYFSSHFYPKTVIYGLPAGRQTVETVKNAVQQKVAGYQLSIEGRESTDTITADEISLVYDDNGNIENSMKKQKSFLWPVMMLMKKADTQIGTRYDAGRVRSVLSSMPQLQAAGQIEPQDAYLGGNGIYYEIVPEVIGNTLDFDKTNNAVLSALDAGKTQLSLESAGCYINPAVYRTDKALNAEMNAKNALLGADLSYNFGDRTEQINVKGFIDQGPDGKYFISQEKVWNYVADLADKYDTYGADRTFYTSLGTTVELSGGDYGWQMDQAETAQALLEKIQAKESGTIDPVYTHTAMSRNANDIGGTYVEISISQQTMWCYQDGYLMVETPVVTGNPNKNNGTPSGGVWAIDGKMTNYTLVGENYRTPVSYWMPFNGGVGIHDLKSRGAWGGSIYLSNGSHGCVNTPLQAVSQIFDIVSVGTPVIVYD